MTFRRAVLADASRLAEFATRVFVHTYSEFNTPEDMQSYLQSSYGAEHQTRELADAGMITVLAESGGALVGYAQVRRGEVPSCVTDENPAEIYRFYVDPVAHGKGVAQNLMQESFSAARDLGGKHLWLGVWERNARAIAFYKKNGFRKIGSQYFQLGSDRQRDLILIRSLSE